MCAIILVLFVIILAINSTVFITKTQIFYMNKGNTTMELTHYCERYPILESTMKIVHPIIQVYIPYLVMIVLNVIVILRLRQSKSRSSLSMTGVRNHMNKFAVSTILIDLIFLLFKSPSAILQNIWLFYKFNKTNK